MFDSFKAAIKAEFEEFAETGRMLGAIAMSKATGHHFNHSNYPLYFTGALDAPMVLIHLNPKQANDYAERYLGPIRWQSFDEYFAFHERFGHHMYGVQSARTHRSPFDHRQIRFLRPFNVVEFVSGVSSDDRYTNLERAIDCKCQLELVPYGSDSFKTHQLKPELLQPLIDRLLQVITECPRRYVVFCGTVFAKLLRSRIVHTERFLLRKQDGSWTTNRASFSWLQLPHHGKVVHAGIAHSFAQQGIPLSRCGEECRRRYDQFLSC